MRPVRFFRYTAFFGMAATGGIYAAPTNQSIIFIIIYGRGRGVPRPYRVVYFYCPVGRGDPTPPQKHSPLGRRWRACAPDEGEMSGSCNKPTRIIAIAAKWQGGVKTPPYE